MPVEKLSATDFGDQIASGVNDRDRTVDTRVGPIRDIFIDPVSGVLENQNDRAVYLNRLLSLENADTLVPDDVDSIVFNENMVRWGGSRSITVLSFSRVNPPTVDITVPINFPVSTKIDPVTGSSIIFRTIESQTMYAASAGQYYDSTTQKYELDVAAASVSRGTTASVGAYTITEMRRPLDQFDEVTNKDATDSGRSVETNAELATRYLLHVEGSQVATPQGLKSFMLDNISSVEDAYIVYGNNAFLTRDDDDAGAVDVWVLGSTPLARTYVTLYNGTYTLNSVDFQPLIKVTQVSSAATGLTYTEGTDYEVETGVGEYSYSNLGQDGIRWIPGGSHPDIGDDVIIQYQYNSLINILDAYFKQPQFYGIGSDKLFRWAQPTSLEIDANLKVKSGSPSEVTNAVRTAVTDYINDLKLGDNVEEFDLDALVGKIFGVDNWTYNQLSVKDGTGIQDVEIDPNTYARIVNADFVISLV
jgi:hypothetical protein